MLDFMSLAIIFWIVMIILDGIIAFYIPARRMEARLKRFETKKEIVNLYGKGIFNALKPQLKDERNKIVNYVEHRVNKKIDRIVTNDIPHLLDNKMAVIDKEIGDVKHMMGSTLSAGRNLKSNMRKQETLYKLKSLIETNPQLENMTNVAMLGISNGYMTWSQLNKLIDNYYMLQQFKGGKGIVQTTEEMSPLQTGARLPAVPTLQEESQPEEANMGQIKTMSEKKQEAWARKEFTKLGVPKAVLDETFTKRKEVLEGVNNAKTKKEKKRERKKPRDSSIRDSAQSSGEIRNSGSAPEDTIGG